MDKFFKKALITGTATLGLGLFGSKNLEAQIPQGTPRAPSEQEALEHMSEKESLLRADLHELEVNPVENKEAILEIKKLLEEFEQQDPVDSAVETDYEKYTTLQHDDY
jgi:hypothetical protein